MLLELPLLLYGTLIVASLIVLLTKQYFVGITCLQERPAAIRELSLHFPLLGRKQTNTQVGILHSAIYSKCVLLDCRRQLYFTFLGYMTCSYSKIFQGLQGQNSSVKTMYYSVGDFMKEQHHCIYKHRGKLKPSEEGAVSLQPSEVCTMRELTLSAEVVLESKTPHSVIRIQCYIPVFCLRHEHFNCKKSGYLSHIPL